MKTKIFLLFLILQFLNLLILNNIYAKEDADYWFNEGGKAFEVGNYDKAIEYYTKVIEINPKYAEAYYDRGLAYDDKGLYDKAIELNSEYAEAYCVRGRVYRILGNCIKANADYKKACSYKCH